MKLALISVLAASLVLTAAATAQDAIPLGQAPPSGAGGGGQRGGRGVMMGGGRGVSGTVTEVAADHYTIKTDAGETYTVHFSVNTRILKQTVQRRGPGGGAEAAGSGGAAAPQALKPADIKVGDAVAAIGELDQDAKSIGAIMVLQIDPERARQLREMQANYGKTWLIGKVTAINEAKVSLLGSVDNAIHTFQADENTAFRKHRDPITLADIQVGDMVRAEGAVKDGSFLATTVSVMGTPAAGMPAAPRDGSPAPRLQ